MCLRGQQAGAARTSSSRHPVAPAVVAGGTPLPAACCLSSCASSWSGAPRLFRCSRAGRAADASPPGAPCHLRALACWLPLTCHPSTTAPPLPPPMFLLQAALLQLFHHRGARRGPVVLPGGAAARAPGAADRRGGAAGAGARARGAPSVLGLFRQPAPTLAACLRPALQCAARQLLYFCDPLR